MNITTLYQNIKNDNPRALARAISIVENGVDGYIDFLKSLKFDKHTPIIGITGPPGAGKSTLVNAIITKWSAKQKKIAIIAVDPTSPFNYGSLLGDRIRLREHYNNPNIFIRSLATRGSLGGLSNKIIEIVDVFRAANFDYILLETVGVGQSEVEIAGLADTTIVALVPEAGDEIQTMKAGLMEIADIFVVNKADRADADRFAKNLRQLVHSRAAQEWAIPVIKTVATQFEGIDKLIEAVDKHNELNSHDTTKKSLLLTQKALQLIRTHRMRDIQIDSLQQNIATKMQEKHFNLYAFLLQDYLSS
ncbi:MAG: methylmalonyl Co-A mutase-associated GTPase MeaB [Chitinophagales bacterium]